MEPIFKFLIALAVLIFVVWICRGVILWFFNIDKRTQLLEEQNELLRELVAKLDKPQS